MWFTSSMMNLCFTCLNISFFIRYIFKKVESPMFVGDSNPLPATPSGSQEAVTFLPTKALVILITTLFINYTLLIRF